MPLLTLLPDVLHIPARQAGTALDATLRLLASEISQPQPGAAAVLDRIVDILLVQLLRAWLATGPAQARTPSWLSALTDPVAGPALAVLHTQPGRDWTIPSLAAAIGVSRATLARRFPARVGCTPAAYLTRWRMDLAAVRLRDTDDTVGRREIPRLHLRVRLQPRLHAGPPHPARPLPHSAAGPRRRRPAVTRAPPWQDWRGQNTEPRT